MQHRDGQLFRKTYGYKLIFGSRDFFERSLRREDMKCKRIKQVVGTATGVTPALDDLCRLESVRARLADGSERNFPAALVVGMTLHLFSMTFHKFFSLIV